MELGARLSGGGELAVPKDRCDLRKWGFSEVNEIQPLLIIFDVCPTKDFYCTERRS